MDKEEEYKVVWAIKQEEAETRAFSPMAALGFADQARSMGAEVVKIIHHGVVQTAEEFERTWLKD